MQTDKKIGVGWVVVDDQACRDGRNLSVRLLASRTQIDFNVIEIKIGTFALLMPLPSTRLRGEDGQEWCQLFIWPITKCDSAWQPMKVSIVFIRV